MTRIVSLCSGYGGLDLAAEALTGGTTVAHVEFDAAPSRILAARWPDVPNLHDVKTLAWADLHADVLTAGYPCQPFSGAGKRLGTEDPRHLFPFIARGVERMRPPLLLLENVRGHLSLGFDVVLAELDRIGYDARWTLLRAADVGAPHARSRLWIAARDRQAGGWPAPSGQPTALLEDGEWVSPHGGLFGSIPADTPGTAGSMVGGVRWDSDAAVVNTGGVLLAPWHERALLPTPTTQDASNNGGPSQHERNSLPLNAAAVLLPTPQAHDAQGVKTPEAIAAMKARGHGPRNLNETAAHELGPLSLLPTPAVNDMGAGKTVEAWDAWTEAQRQKHGNGNGHGPSLHIEAARMALLPTPMGSDADKGGPNQAFGSGSLTMSSAVHSEQWGVYVAAVQRWEAVVQRPAPAPTEPTGKGGTQRLSPRFVEWMMGLPAGWVTDVPGVTRNHQLKALGNGVVPQQAQAAFRLLLGDLAREVAA